MRVPLVRPALGDAEIEATARVIRSGWVTQGPEVAAFEQELAAMVGAPHAVAVSNCTTALELALRSLGVGPGDEVITVSHSFIATANAVTAVGARPIFADIQRRTFGMDPELIEALVTSRTRAILPVHQLGIPCDIQRIVAIAARHGLPVVEDAACAIGSRVRAQGAGGAFEAIGKPHGRIACFSFHPRKIVTTGDGGMLTTADPAIAARLRLLRQHAMSVPDTIRHHSDAVQFEEYVEPAYNARLTDLQACIGRTQLQRLPSIVAERRALAERYARALADHPVFQPPQEPPDTQVNWQSYPLMLRPGCGVTQVEAMQFLLDRGVSCRRGVHNAHQEPAYASLQPRPCHPGGCDSPDRCGDVQAHCQRLANSEWARDSIVMIPLFHGMRPEEQEHVIATCNALARRSDP